MKNNIRGLGVALVTPFDEFGHVDVTDLRLLVDHVIEGGVDYIVALGTTSESPTLTCDDRKLIMENIIDKVGGRVPVVMGIGSNCTADVIEKLQTRDLSKVTAVLSVTPYYNKPSQEGLYRHYMAIAEASPVPIILYNVPSRTSVNMEPRTTLRLARESNNIIAIKEACGKIEQVEELLKGRPDGFMVISGDDAMSVPIIKRGGDGVISVVANAFPRPMSQMIAAAMKGDIKKAEEINETLKETYAAAFEEGNPTGVKTALALKGMIGNYLRLPLIPGSDALADKFREIIRKNGF